MKKIKIIAFIILTCLMCQNIFAQAFLKNYTDPSNPNASVSFECITEKTDSSGNLYIGGHIGDTITLFKVNTSGTVLSTFKIKASPANTRLDGIMLVLDAQTNKQKIVVLGNLQTGGNQGFMFRFDPLGTVDWFRQTLPSEAISYWDLADKTGNFYVVSAEKTTDGSALLLQVNKSNGIPSVVSNYKVAGLEDPEAIQLAGSKIYATGRYTIGGGASGFRFCFSRFTSSFAHQATYYYATPKFPTATARMYSNDLLVNGNAAIMVGNGDDDNTADAFENLHITKVNAATGAITWSKKYDDPSAVSDGTLTEIRLDNAGNYTVMGFAVNPNIGGLQKAKLWSVNPSNGNLIWNRQYDLYRRTTNTGSSYEYGFTVVGGYIYAVGQNGTSGITKGVLLKVNTANGIVSKADGTRCDDSLIIKKSAYTFYDSIPVTILSSTISSTKPAKQIIKIKMNDSLVCGTTFTSNCNCQFSVGIDGGSVINVHPKCGDTIKGMVCNASYYFIPKLACDSTNPVTNTISVSVKDQFNNPAPWSVGFNGTGNLTIPAGISGVYTLTYYWGSSGSICDSCKYYLNITCCSNCTLTTDIRPFPSRTPVIYKCNDTASFLCNKSYSFGPSLNCNGDTTSHIIGASIKDPFGGIPSWAAGFMSNLGSGVLAIPTGVTSGIYTLTYAWGINGISCDSCKIYLKITCCTSFTGTAGPDIAACCGGAQFNASASGGILPYTYLWTPATGLSNPNVANPVCNLSGTYTVTIKDGFGCIVSDQAVATIATGSGSCCRNGITDIGTTTTIIVSPNPTTNSFKIKGLNSKKALLEIFNFQGFKVAYYKNVSDGNSFGASLPKGVYMLRFSFTDGTVQSQQLIKN